MNVFEKNPCRESFHPTRGCPQSNVGWHIHFANQDETANIAEFGVSNLLSDDWSWSGGNETSGKYVQRSKMGIKRNMMNDAHNPRWVDDWHNEANKAKWVSVSFLHCEIQMERGSALENLNYSFSAWRLRSSWWTSPQLGKHSFLIPCLLQKRTKLGLLRDGVVLRLLRVSFPPVLRRMDCAWSLNTEVARAIAILAQWLLDNVSSSWKSVFWMKVSFNI